MRNVITARVSKLAQVTNVETCGTIDMMLDTSGTGWEPRMVKPEVAGASTGNHMALVNPSTGRTLAFVGAKYRPNSHLSHVRALEPLVQSGAIMPHRVSSWNDGAMLAYQFRCPELETDIAPARRVGSLLTLAFYHNGSGCDMSFFADFNWYCTNQMGLVRESNDGQRIKHVGDVVDRYADLVSRRLVQLRSLSGERHALMGRMCTKQLKGADVLAFLATSLGSRDIQATMADIDAFAKARQGNPRTPLPKGVARHVVEAVADYRADDAGAPLSVWHTYNGLTRYVTHSHGRDADVRSRSALLGTGAATIERAWELAVSLSV
jgi:hypothetical protein